MISRHTRLVENVKQDPDLIKKAETFCLSSTQLQNAEFPYDFSDGRVKIKNTHKWSTEEIPSEKLRICEHCLKTLEINDVGEFIAKHCVYHPRTKRPNAWSWPCCGAPSRNSGCQSQAVHVHRANLRTDVTGYIQFTSTDPTVEGKMYALDAERVFTKRGMEIADITFIDSNSQVIYKTVVMPNTDIIDYNTRFSGLTDEDFKQNTKTLQEVHEDLKNIIFSNTILVGHGLCKDLRALKICHLKIIDTAETYPRNPKRPAYPSALRYLIKENFGRVIQSGAGHDSGEDAKAAMDLALLKIALAA